MGVGGGGEEWKREKKNSAYIISIIYSFSQSTYEEVRKEQFFSNFDP